MFKIYPKTSLLICCLLLTAGCSQFMQHAARTEPARLSASAPGNNYYYFTASQLQKSKGNIDTSIALMKKAIDRTPYRSVDGWGLNRRRTEQSPRLNKPAAILGHILHSARKYF